MERVWRIAPSLAGYLTALAIAGLVLWLYLPVRVAGQSMHPSLHAGDVAMVRLSETVRPGDIVLMESEGGGRVLHRVVERLSDGSVRTIGDANDCEDSVPTPADRIVGKVAFSLPVGRLAMHRFRGIL